MRKALKFFFIKSAISFLFIIIRAWCPEAGKIHLKFIKSLKYWIKSEDSIGRVDKDKANGNH
jgi:hypothetical protein